LGHLELVPAEHRRPAAVAAAGPGGGQPSVGPFADEVAFELGRGGEHVEDELAAGVVVSIASCRLRNPMPRSASPVMMSTRWRNDRPRRSSFQTTRVSPRAELVQELLEGGPVGAGAACGLGEYPVAAGALEGVDLEFRLLVSRGDASIAEQMSHAADRRRTL
jgi:hypothetical protein